MRALVWVLIIRPEIESYRIRKIFIHKGFIIISTLGAFRLVGFELVWPVKAFCTNLARVRPKKIYLKNQIFKYIILTLS